MMNFGQVLVLHVLQLVHQTLVLQSTLAVFDEIFWVVHYVLVGSLLCPVEVCWTEIVVLDLFDEC